jgi:hypothetical protein
MVAQLRHDTPVLGAAAEAVVLRHSVLGVEFAHFVLPPEGQQIRQTISARLIEGAPVPGGAKDLGCSDTGEPLASAVPDHDASRRVNDEGGDDQMLHQPHGIGMRNLGATFAGHLESFPSAAFSLTNVAALPCGNPKFVRQPHNLSLIDSGMRTPPC